jgi:hypothetical protein
MRERAEEGLVQEFAAQAAVEALDERVLDGLAGCDCQPTRLSCAQRRTALEVSSVPLSETIVAGRPRSGDLKSGSDLGRSS